MTRGFTLIELLFVLAVAAILLTVGLPSFQSTVRNSRLTTTVNDIVASMQLSRSEALKRRVPVVMCAHGGTDSCDANASWTDGWMVFSDDNGNGSPGDAGEVILRQAGAVHRKIRIRLPTAQPMQERLVYAANGFPDMGGLDAAGLMVICDDQSSDYFGRVIEVPQTGRPLGGPIGKRPDLGVSCE